MTHQPINMTGGEALAKQLVLEGTTDLFGVPGVQLDWAVDAISKEPGLRYFSMRHEQAASYAADGYARSSGRNGVCMVVPGPGLFNAMAGLATAYACSSPVLAIVGQIATSVMGKGYGALHEVPDQSRALDTVTKWHALARRPEEVPGLIREAMRQMNSGRPRPVALELPPDVLQARADIRLCEPGQDSGTKQVPDAQAIHKTAALLRKAKRIGIYAGWGVTTAKATEELRQLAELLQAPVAHSSNGRGALSDTHPLALPGIAGRALFLHCDVILVIGSRMMDSGGKTTFSNFGTAQMVYINAEESEFSAPRRPDVAVLADAKLALQALLDELRDVRPVPSRAEETAQLRQWAEVQFAEVQPQWGIIQSLRSAMPDAGILVGEMTQVSYVSRMAYPVYRPRTHLTPGYQGTLGFGYCTALGAAVANPGTAVVSINGDGGFLFGSNEMASAKKYSLPVVAVVFNDKAYGNVKRLQQMQFGRNYGVDLVNPDWVKYAQAFGIQAEQVDASQLEGAVRSAIASKAPALIEVPVGEMPNPSHLNSESVPRKTPAPPNPLDS